MKTKKTPYQKSRYKTNCCWMLAKDFGKGVQFFESTASHTIADAKKKTVDPFDNGPQQTWEHWRDDGYYIARVQIKEIR